MSLSPPNTTGANLWVDTAINVRNNFFLSSEWKQAYWYGCWQVLSSITTLAWEPSWQSLLSNGTVNNPANPPNNLTGIVYGTLPPIPSLRFDWKVYVCVWRRLLFYQSWEWSVGDAEGELHLSRKLWYGGRINLLNGLWTMDLWNCFSVYGAISLFCCQYILRLIH